MEARNLKASVGYACDPYCVIEVEDKFNQTAYKPSSTNPIWKETFQFNIARGSNQAIKFTVKDYDMFSADDVIGVVQLWLNSKMLFD